MFIIEAEENKCVVPLERLSDQMIKSFQPSRKMPEIDPYSSLEEVFSDNSEPQLDAPEEKPMKRDVAKYNMRERKKKTLRHSDKPLRSNQNSNRLLKIVYSKFGQ